MAKCTAFALLALIALAFVAQAHAQTRFCRVSAYKLPCARVVANKAALFRSCGLKPSKLVPSKVGACCTYLQQVPNSATWDAYSKCEKEAAQKAFYDPLKNASDACKAAQKRLAC